MRTLRPSYAPTWPVAGWIGAGVGVLAAWVALPPVSLRAPIVPTLLGTCAVALGVMTIAHRAYRPGTYAVMAGLLGGLLGWAATNSTISNLEDVVVWSALFTAMLRWATPLIFAAIGGLFSERSGVVNIGLEGMMLMGAFFGVLGAERTGSWELGLALGVLSGGLMALLHAVFSIHVRVDQIVAGTAINFLALGLTGYLFVDIYGQEGIPSDIPTVPDVDLGVLAGTLGFLTELPVVGGAFQLVGSVVGDLNLMVWLALLTMVAAWVVIFRMPVGLRIRAVGEHPLASESAGISVFGIRYACVVLSGMLAAAGGAYLSIGFVGSFSENMTAGRGFIALAALIFGNWRPFGAGAACLMFGFSSALALRLPVYSESSGLPIDVLFQALPYVLTLVAVAGVIGRSIPPAAVGRPYRKQ